MKNNKFKKFFTKRKVLIFVNLFYMLLLATICFFSICMTTGVPVYESDIAEVLVLVFGYVMSQCSFTALSLIVYYLAIMAGALNKKYKDEVKDTEYEDKN